MRYDLNPATDAEKAVVAWAEDSPHDEAKADALVQRLLEADARWLAPTTPTVRATFDADRARAMTSEVALGAIAAYRSLLKATTAHHGPQDGGYASPQAETAGDPDDYDDPFGQNYEWEEEQAETVEDVRVLMNRLDLARIYDDPRPWAKRAEDGYLMLFLLGKDGTQSQTWGSPAVLFSGCLKGLQLAIQTMAKIGWHLDRTCRAADVPRVLHNAHLRGKQHLDLAAKIKTTREVGNG